MKVSDRIARGSHPVGLPESGFNVIKRAARFLGVALFSCAVSAHAADPAWDDASQAAYSGGGNFHNLNGGDGFAPWETSPQVNDDEAGLYTGDSNVNGFGDGPGINTGEGTAFGFYARLGASASAARKFNGPLLEGERFSIDFDNGVIIGDDSVQGFALLDAGGEARFAFEARSGEDFYVIEDAEGGFSTGIPLTDGGLRIVLTVVTDDLYTLAITDLAGGMTTTFTEREFGGEPGEFVEEMRVYHVNTFEGGPDSDLFINQLALLPPAEDDESSPCLVELIEGAVPACPASINSFGAPEGGDAYAWRLANNSSGASLLGAADQMFVLVSSGMEAGSFDLVLDMTVGEAVYTCSLTVPVLTTPTPEAGNNSPICEGEDLVLTATPIPDATYTWVGPNFFLASEQNPIVISAGLAAAGEYSVSASRNGCPSGISTTLVTIHARPDCLIEGDAVLCPGTEEVVFYAPNDLISYTWELEGDATLINDPFEGFVRIIPDESGSFILTLTVIDNNGCAVTCTRSVVIGDVEPPELECPADVVLSPGSDTSIEALGEATATDACDGNPAVSYEDEVLPGDCDGSVVILRTWTAVDASGNAVSCVQTIVLADVEPPVLTVPDSVQLSCGADTSPEALGFATAFDLVDPAPTITFYDEVYSIDCADYVIIERLWVAEDACGNIAEEFQIIVVEDSQAPVMTVPADTTVGLNDDYSPEALGFATAEDDCDAEPAIGYFDQIAEGACASQFTVVRVWFAEDACGNLAEAVQIIQVGGGEVTLVIPADAVVECDGDLSPEALGLASATDALGEAVPVDYADEVIESDCDGRYIVRRIWFAEDSCGNGSEATQFIVVDDTIAPVLEIPADAEVACGSDISTSVLGEATAVDNCDGEPMVSFEDVITDVLCGSSYTVERVWRAIDQCGNIAEAIQRIVVRDETGPELMAPDDVEVACGTDLSPDVLGFALAGDNCEPEVSVSYTDLEVEGACGSDFVVERTWRATDACGNISEAIQVITVRDTTAPVLVIPDDVALACGAATDPAFTGIATAEDACGGTVDVSYADAWVDDVLIRTWTAMDACGNATSGEQVIAAIPDAEAPVLTVPADMAVGCFDDLSPEALGIAIAEDGCDPNPVVTYDDTVVPGDCSGRYVIERRWMAVDALGNGSEAVQLIAVDDATAPVLTVPADVAVGCGESTDPVNTGAATATDGCSGVASISYADDVSGSVITRTWTAVDGCGNSVSGVQMITASGGGQTPPVITSPGNQVVVAACGQPVAFAVPTATSDCDPNVSVVVQPPSGSLLGAGAHVITATATDAAGNQSTVTYTVTVLTPLRVVFDSPLKDDNLPNNIETDQDVVNLFKSGSTIPHKVKLLDCSGKDVTKSVANLVNVKLNVTLRMYQTPTQSVQLLNMWQLPKGVGDLGGNMKLTGNHFQYNLWTLLYPPNTANMPWFFRSHVTVEYKAAPGIVVGEEDALLESRL